MARDLQECFELSEFNVPQELLPIPKPLCVRFNKAGPFVRHRCFVEDSCHRANQFTSCAIDTLVRINVILRCVVGGVDAVNRAYIDA